MAQLPQQNSLNKNKFYNCSTNDKKYKTDYQSTTLLVLFWITVVTLSPCYIWTFLLLTKWSITLPFMKVYTALKIQLFTLAIGCGFVPFALPFNNWSKGADKPRNHFAMKILHLIGSLLAILLATLSLIIIEDYKLHLYVQTEYQTYVQGTIKQNKFPDFAVTDVFENDCCFWNGPHDFEIILEHNKSLHKEQKEFMDKVSVCYNNFFETIINDGIKPGTNDELIFQPKKLLTELPPGCGSVILRETRKTCNFIAFASILTIILTGLTLLAYITPDLFKRYAKIYPRLPILTPSESNHEFID